MTKVEHSNWASSPAQLPCFLLGGNTASVFQGKVLNDASCTLYLLINTLSALAQYLVDTHMNIIQITYLRHCIQSNYHSGHGTNADGVSWRHT